MASSIFSRLLNTSAEPVANVPANVSTNVPANVPLQTRTPSPTNVASSSQQPRQKSQQFIQELQNNKNQAMINLGINNINSDEFKIFYKKEYPNWKKNNPSVKEFEALIKKFLTSKK